MCAWFDNIDNNVHSNLVDWLAGRSDSKSYRINSAIIASVNRARTRKTCTAQQNGKVRYNIGGGRRELWPGDAVPSSRIRPVCGNQEILGDRGRSNRTKNGFAGNQNAQGNHYFISNRNSHSCQHMTLIRDQHIFISFEFGLNWSLSIDKQLNKYALMSYNTHPPACSFRTETNFNDVSH